MIILGYTHCKEQSTKAYKYFGKYIANSWMQGCGASLFKIVPEPKFELQLRLRVHPKKEKKVKKYINLVNLEQSIFAIIYTFPVQHLDEKNYQHFGLVWKRICTLREKKLLMRFSYQEPEMYIHRCCQSRPKKDLLHNGGWTNFCF